MPSPSRNLKWIHSKDSKYVMLLVDADKVPSEILQKARSLCFELLDSCKASEAIQNFPYKLGGGWTDIDPDDAFVTYAQIIVGTFALTSASARGSSKEKRERGAALGRMLAAAANPEYQLDLCDRSPVIVEMAEWATRKMQALRSAKARAAVRREPVDRRPRAAVKCEPVDARPSDTERIDQLEAVVARLTERIDKLEAQPQQQVRRRV